jgi:hypothetical protein
VELMVIVLFGHCFFSKASVFGSCCCHNLIAYCNFNFKNDQLFRLGAAMKDSSINNCLSVEAIDDCM